MLPDSPVTPAALLIFQSRNMGLLSKDRVGLFAGSCRIDLFQIGQSEGRLGRIFPGIIGVKVAKIRLALLQLRNDQTHLQTPVAQMHITDGVVT